MRNEDDKIIIECDCGTHLLRTEFDEEDKLFYIAFYTYGNGNMSIRSNIWNRIKYAFQHIFTGKIFSDQMVLNQKETKKLVDFINDRIKLTH